MIMTKILLQNNILHHCKHNTNSMRDDNVDNKDDLNGYFIM